jgi:hypothetical protein
MNDNHATTDVIVNDNHATTDVIVNDVTGESWEMISDQEHQRYTNPCFNKYDDYEEYELLCYASQPTGSVIRGFIRDKQTLETKAVSYCVEQPVVISCDGTVESVLKNDIGRYTFARGYEATAIRVWKNNGRVFTSTHKRIHPDNSKWGKSPSFTDMYRGMNGPTDSLFDPAEPNSKFCHLFLMVHHQIMICSFDPEHGYLVYVGSVDVTNPSRLIPPENAQFPPPAHVRPVQNLTITEANNYLQHGWGKQAGILGVDGVVRHVPENEPLLRSGEFIIATEWEGVPWQSDVVAIHQVLSESYNFRCSLRKNIPNVWNRIFTLSNDAQSDINEYGHLYPWYSSVMPADATGCYRSNHTNGPVDIPLVESTVTQRLHNLWNLFVFSVPLTMKAQVTMLVHAFHIERHLIGRWIHDIYMAGKYAEADTRIQQIIVFASKNSRLQRCKTLQAAIHLVLRNEYGESLYRLWSTKESGYIRHKNRTTKAAPDTLQPPVFELLQRPAAKNVE